MNKAVKYVRRAMAYLKMRSIEIRLAGMINSRPKSSNSLASIGADMAIKKTSAELCQARANYQALLPCGERRTWNLA